MECEELSVGTYNMHCNFDISGEYLKTLSRKAQIIAVQEHGLFPCEMYKLEKCTILKGFCGTGKPSAQLSDDEFEGRQRIGGCGILWKKSLQFKVVRHPKEGSDRVCMIELKLATQKIFILCVYLPHQTCKIASFDQELKVLCNMLDKYRTQGMCIVLGDMNIGFGSEYGPRCSGLSYNNVRPFMNAMNAYGMQVVDIGDEGRGETYTFVGGHGASYLDHVVVSSEDECKVVDCTVLSDCVENVSDHLPVILRTNIRLNNKQLAPALMKRKVAWHKLDESEIKEKYTQPLEEKSLQILRKFGLNPEFVINLPEYCGISFEKIDAMLHALIEAMITVGEGLQHNDFNKHIKPYWTEEVENAANKKDEKRAIYTRSSAFPNKDCTECEELKDAKREFRRLRRIAIKSYEVKEMNELNETEEIDSKFFWWLASQNKVKIVSPICNEKGEIITDPYEIQQDWNEYYKNLYTESEDEAAKYDEEFKVFVENQIPMIEEEMIEKSQGKYLKGGPITHTDIEKIIKKLPKGKACGFDQVTSEHLHHAGVIVRSIITMLLNGIIKCSKIPQRLKKGLIVSIPKPNKDSHVKGNNRGLTLLPTIYKVLEKVIMMRENDWIQKTICPIQSCGKEHVSCVHTSFAVQQAVAVNLNEGRAVHGALLDTRKAFDALWILGMMYKLYKEKLNPKAWLLAYDSYQNFMCTAYVNGIAGPWFTPKRGVHQGAPLSMVWYTVLVNDLLKDLCNYRNGLCVRNLMLSSPAHADDVTVLTSYKTGLNDMLKMSLAYGKKWRYSYNTDKTVYMCWGNDLYPHIQITFEDEILKPEKESKHMGVTLTTEKKSVPSICQKRIGKGKFALLSGFGLGGSSVRTSPNTMSKIYWGVAIPKMLFGIEVTPTDETCLEMLEDNHRYNARLIQNLPTRTPKPASVMLLGWKSLKAYIAYMKITFLIRVLCLEQDSLYRKLLIIGIDQYLDNGPQKIMTPVCDMMNYVIRYRLTDIVASCRAIGTWKMVNPLKKKVKNVILRCDEDEIKASCLLYRNLSCYRDCVQYGKLNVWWKCVKKSSNAFKDVSCVVALLCGTQPSGYGANFGSRRRCNLCCDYSTETLEHILFECTALETRQASMKIMLDYMPTGMRESFLSMNNQAKAKFILSGLGSETYLYEWQNIYLSASKFIHDLYRERANKYNMISD